MKDHVPGGSRLTDCVVVQLVFHSKVYDIDSFKFGYFISHSFFDQGSFTADKLQLQETKALSKFIEETETLYFVSAFFNTYS